MSFFRRDDRDERGATAVEYGLMIAMIALVVVGIIGVFGTKVSLLFTIPAGVFGR